MFQGWMFKLVGLEPFSFTVNGEHHSGSINIEPDGFKYIYTLSVDGKRLDKFTENLRRLTQTWNFRLEMVPHIVVLGLRVISLLIA